MFKPSARFAALVSTLAFQATATAADSPSHIVGPVDETFQHDELTQACGTPVLLAIEGTLRITLRTDQDGALHETDKFTDWSFTLSAPAFGTSFSYRFGPGFFEYPEGVELGAPAIMTSVGVDTNVPGFHAFAGRTVLAGEVVDFTPDGVPIAVPTDRLFQAGNQVELAEKQAAICAALTGQ